MKLIRCHIERFGCLNNFDYSFNDGLGVLIANNGWGKSTLAVFIKAMLYGLGDTGVRDLEKNERKHYLPWQGGVCAGSLEFSYNGKRYLIERSFDVKESGDTFKLYDSDTMQISQDFDKNLGLSLFGVDANGYERSVYISQRSEPTKNETIIAALTGLLESVDDANNYETAIKRLNERRTFYIKTGKRGEIDKLEGEIAELDRKLNESSYAQSEAIRLSSLAENLNKKLEEKREELAIIKTKIAENAKKEGDKGKAEYLAEQKRRLTALIEELNRLENVYKYLPPDEEITEYYGYNKKLQTLRQEMIELSVALTECPDNEKKEIELLELRELCQKASLRRVTADTAEREKELSADNEYSQKEVPTEKKRMLPYLIGISVGLILIIVGAIFIANKPSIGIVLLVFGLIGIVLCVVFIVLRKGRNNLNKTDESVESIPIGRDNTESEYEEKLRAFFGIDVSLEEGESLISDSLSRVAAEKEKREKIVIDIKENKSIVEDLSQKIELWRKGICLNDEGDGDFSSLRLHKENLGRLKEEKAVIEDSIRDFAEKNGEISPPSGPFDSVAELQKKEKEAEKEISLLIGDRYDIENKLAKTERIIAESATYQEERQFKSERCQKYKDNVELIDRTIKYLQVAKDSLSKRYLAEMTKSYKKYADILIKKECGQPILNSKLEIMVNASGSNRDIKSFSCGTRDILEFCMRLALVDTLFVKEKPFLILDDPFVNFDDENFELAIVFLKEIALSCQVLLLTCGEKRHDGIA